MPAELMISILPDLYYKYEIFLTIYLSIYLSHVHSLFFSFPLFLSVFLPFSL